MTDSTLATAGQATADPGTGTTAQAPNGAAQPGAQAQTTGNGPDAAATVESFFDPASIADKPELLTAYKQMQGHYTKRMQEFAGNRSKVEAFDRFQADPIGMMRQIAAQHGYQFVQGSPQGGKPEDWAPQTWDDVLAKAKEHVLEEMQPVFNEVRSLKKQNIETYLDGKFPDWRTYETDMMDVLKNHPTLVGDPDRLYRMSVPPEVLEARATKAAMQKLQAKTDNAQVSGGQTTKQTTSSERTGPLSFDQAVEAARSKLAGLGMKRPA
jgi:hypothetical protein